MDVAATSGRLTERDGAHYWLARVPANGSATFRYTIRSER
jgi:hypothetical protein